MRTSKYNARGISLSDDLMDVLGEHLPETLDNVQSYLNSKDADHLVNELLRAVDEHVIEAREKLSDITK